ncbi:hypothetical protein Scep_025334 [Stephania cephalantha]|uniref:RING-type E3 ubiquitin transferase n=1 Tax=Stephania cephalantha TaxID=152367 RepID=A0AAP0EI15_9MAGN
MVKDIVVTAALLPASEALSQLVESIVATVRAAKDVLIEKKSFEELSAYLERIIPVLDELSSTISFKNESLNNVVEILEREINAAKQLTSDCSKKNRVFLLINCRKIVKRLEDITREISRALSLIPLASLDISSGIKEEIDELSKSMLEAEFRATVAEEEILAKIDTGILERNFDRSYANQLLILIAEAVGISTERAELKKEFEDFKKEIEETLLRKNLAEAIQMDQIIALLGRADAALSPEEKVSKYFNKRNSLGNQPLDPLDSFYCPITGEVMVDPVETSSGQTFERSAIEKWFAEGNNLCPLTATPLNSAALQPNKALRKSIAEWKDRNTMITIALMKAKLSSNEEKEVIDSLGQLQELCEEREMYREWVVLENYIPVLVQLLVSKNREIRNRALALLYLLAKDSDDNKVMIMEVHDAIDSIARFLARRIGESKLAVALLLELSKNERICNYIGKIQGCVFLLVTMLSSNNDSQAASDAKDLLENLAVHDENVILMAKANYFKPLLQRLSSGSEDVQMIMTKTLAEMELSDYYKLVLFESGVLDPLIQLVSHVDIEMKLVAARALQSLSTVPQNGLWMIREGAMGALLDLLYHGSTSCPSLRELAAVIIMNIAISTTNDEAGQIEAPLLENDDDIFKLFSLINLTPPNVQKCILQIFHAMCRGPSAADIKSKIRQTAIPVLVLLCEQSDNAVRANAVKLFYCLSEEGSDSILSEHVGQTCIETLLKVMTTSDDVEEITAAMGIISNLPVGQITQWLFDGGVLPIIFKILKDGNGLSRNQLIENAVGSLRRFTVPTNLEWQRNAARIGIIPVLLQLLSSGTALTKQHAAISLAQFSSSSTALSRPIDGRGRFWCCSASREIGCPVHRGICVVESSFCLVEANAVAPLVGVLTEPDLGAREASLLALLTLIDGEKLQSGCKVLDDANAIDAIIKLLGCSSISLQEKALEALERIFRIFELKHKYGSVAQMRLVDITQRGTSSMKSLAARILAHLDILHAQSSYF